MTLPATLSDPHSHSNAAYVLCPNTAAHQNPNREQPHLAEKLEIQIGPISLAKHSGKSIIL